jgi:hypothetical protein
VRGAREQRKSKIQPALLTNRWLPRPKAVKVMTWKVLLVPKRILVRTVKAVKAVKAAKGN